MPLPPGKVLLYYFRRDVSKGPFAVVPPNGFLQGQGIDVRGQEVNLPVVQIGEQAVEQDGDGIDLLPGGAACAPDPQAPPLLTAVADQFRQNAVFQGRQARFFPEEIGLTHSEMAGQDFYLLPGQRGCQNLLGTGRGAVTAQIPGSRGQAAGQVRRSLGRKK